MNFASLIAYFFNSLNFTASIRWTLYVRLHHFLKWNYCIEEATMTPQKAIKLRCTSMCVCATLRVEFCDFMTTETRFRCIEALVRASSERFVHSYAHYAIKMTDFVSIQWMENSLRRHYSKVILWRVKLVLARHHAYCTMYTLCGATEACTEIWMLSTIYQLCRSNDVKVHSANTSPEAHQTLNIGNIF